MNVYEMFETDKSVEKDGVEIDYGEFKIQIARSGGANQKYNNIMKRLSKPHERAIQTDSLSDEVAKKILIECHAKAVVLGWTGVEDRGGNEIPFSVENCVKLFEDLPDLFEDIKTQAGKSSIFKKYVDEETVGN